MRLLEAVGMVAAAAMPLWNVPLILRIERRRSSGDISLAWVLGVWACILLMSPAAVRSSDPAFRLFGWMNLVLFTGVVVQVLRFRDKRAS
ncbi:MAG: hypothetical protein A3B78_01455 [Omnitrophica WOR_2 bacterium RIFCSPHIGHO2_02_FULL_67_20]|nr:MAG: hypothetical protein A3B78_01455 [Omnitrophica WOR_2 bacterium RIFCSPHIGHO2_02_FULL_67_20]